MNVDDLSSYLFTGSPHALSSPLMSWLTSSRRFAAFVGATKSKIRKKLRTARDPESAADLRLELETAYLLLQERQLSIDYEPQTEQVTLSRLRRDLYYPLHVHARGDAASDRGVRPIQGGPPCRHGLQQIGSVPAAAQQRSPDRVCPSRLHKPPCTLH